jgi:hypothetical protein
VFGVALEGKKFKKKHTSLKVLKFEVKTRTVGKAGRVL